MAAQEMKPGEREGRSEEQEESFSPGSKNLQPEASIATSHMHGTLASVGLPATLTCSRPTASCQLLSSVTYTKIIKKKNLLQLKYLPMSSLVRENITPH